MQSFDLQKNSGGSGWQAWLTNTQETMGSLKMMGTGGLGLGMGMGMGGGGDNTNPLVTFPSFEIDLFDI